MKSRRNFIQKSSIIGLGSGLVGGFPNFLIAKDLKNNSPNETINFGVIGCKGHVRDAIKSSPFHERNRMLLQVFPPSFVW